VGVEGDERSLEGGVRVRRRVMCELHLAVDGTKFEGKQSGDCAANSNRIIPMRDGSTINDPDDQGDRSKRVELTFIEYGMMLIISAMSSRQ